MRTGVFVCRVGSDKALDVDVRSVLAYAANLPDVEVATDLGVSSAIDPSVLSSELKAKRLERVVIAGYSPGFFKPAFTKAMTLAGGDPDEVRLASFREHGALSDVGTARAKSVVACAVLGAARASPARR